ncbi:MAG: family 43 glycosylhydrolase [Bacteroidota bacterium]|nr:family 43 glycosylhydrolase [Bacteroidota bacterium]
MRNELALSGKMMYGDSFRDGVPFAKDPYVISFGGRYLMYYSVHGYTDKAGTSHGWVVGIAESKDLKNWKRIGEVNPDPKATYETKGFVAPCALVSDGKVNLFYQTCENGTKDAKSADGINWTRLSDQPFLPNSKPGEWNSSESGHPHIFANPNGDDYLFFQGNNDNGKTWYLSNVRII